MSESSRPRRRLLVLAAGLLVLVAGAGVAAVLLRGEDKETISYPDAWADEVLPYVEIVEKERDLDFKRPIHVEFLADKEFRSQVTEGEDDLSKEDRDEIEQFTGMMRALGVIEGDLDLFEEINELGGAGIVGYYSYDDKRIRIRGKKLGPATKVTLVHELTHALQDQHFDLGKRQEEFEDDDDSAAAGAFDALVEGDASRIEAAYEEGLSKKEKAALARVEKAERRKADKEVKDVPEILKTFMGAPYALGEAMLALAVELDGNDAVDELFEEPPSTEEHLFDPWTLLEDEEEALDVDEPDLAKGEDEFDSGEFGAFGWYVVLAERLPLLTALDAVDGWGGDAYVAFERDDVSCVRVDYRADSDDDLAQMHDAVKAWVAALPDGPASVEVDDDRLTFESCDPGTGADVGRDKSQEALDLALTRVYTSLGIMNAGAEEEMARCFANGAVHRFPWRKLLDPSFGGPDDPDVQARAQKIAEGCR